MYKKILIAYDGSAHSQHALDCAQDLAQKYAAQLILVHAFHPIPAVGYTVLGEGRQQPYSELPKQRNVT
jgi:nucleotide-binding universal stress UspA family protein